MKKFLLGFFLFYMLFSMIILPFSITFLFQSINHIFFQEYTIELDLNYDDSDEADEEDDDIEESDDEDDTDEDDDSDEADNEEDDDSLST